MNKQQGLSFVEMLMVMGLSGIIGSAIMSYMKISSEQMSLMEFNFDKQQAMQETTMFLANPSICSSSLVDLPFHRSEAGAGINLSSIYKTEQDKAIGEAQALLCSDPSGAKACSKRGKVFIKEMRILFQDTTSDYPENLNHTDLASLSLTLKSSNHSNSTEVKKIIPISLKMRTNAQGETTVLSCFGANPEALNIQETICNLQKEDFVSETNSCSGIKNLDKQEISGNFGTDSDRFFCPIGSYINSFSPRLSLPLANNPYGTNTIMNIKFSCGTYLKYNGSLIFAGVSSVSSWYPDTLHPFAVEAPAYMCPTNRYSIGIQYTLEQISGPLLPLALKSFSLICSNGTSSNESIVGSSSSGITVRCPNGMKLAGFSIKAHQYAVGVVEPTCY